MIAKQLVYRLIFNTKKPQTVKKSNYMYVRGIWAFRVS